jgi:hypothetical protein
MRRKQLKAQWTYTVKAAHNVGAVIYPPTDISTDTKEGLIELPIDDASYISFSNQPSHIARLLHIPIPKQFHRWSSDIHLSSDDIDSINNNNNNSNNNNNNTSGSSNSSNSNSSSSSVIGGNNSKNIGGGISNNNTSSGSNNLIQLYPRSNTIAIYKR